MPAIRVREPGSPVSQLAAAYTFSHALCSSKEGIGRFGAAVAGREIEGAAGHTTSTTRRGGRSQARPCDHQRAIGVCQKGCNPHCTLLLDGRCRALLSPGQLPRATVARRQAPRHSATHRKTGELPVHVLGLASTRPLRRHKGTWSAVKPRSTSLEEGTSLAYVVVPCPQSLWSLSCTEVKRAPRLDMAK